MRTERITLEVTVDMRRIFFPGQWHNALRESGALMPGESVRVVEETHFDDLAQVGMHRDAAIRERDELRMSHSTVRHHHSLVCEKRDKLQARVAELEAQLESVACRAATAETALEAASGGGEPVTWGVTMPGHETYGKYPVWSVRHSEDLAKRHYNEDGWIHFPLYRAPPQPRGWLSGEERKCIEAARTLFGGMSESKDPAKVLLQYWVVKEERDRIVSALRRLLARSSPPEVVLESWREAAGEVVSLDDVCAALSTIGVAVKKVRK
jgi:hypothetical protein